MKVTLQVATFKPGAGGVIIYIFIFVITFQNCSRVRSQQYISSLAVPTPHSLYITAPMCTQLYIKTINIKSNVLVIVHTWGPLRTITRANTDKLASTMQPRTDLRFLSPSRRGL